MDSLLKNIRFYVIVFSLIFSLGVYYWVTSTSSSEQTQLIRLQQIYALTALAFLYLALLVGPLCFSFQKFPFRDQFLKARRAIGVSAFYFGLLHALLSFFGQLGGFQGLGFLSDKYLLAITLSFIALIILFLMALTSFDAFIAKLTFPRWKLLHRFVYLAGVFILIHALMLGTHFYDLSTLIPQILFIALMFLLALEALRFDAFLQKKLVFAPQFGISFALVIGIVASYFFLTLIPKDSLSSLGIHAQHIQIAKQAQLGNSNLGSNSLPNIPGLKGDKTRRFTVDFDHPEIVRPNQDVPLTFKVYDAASGNRVNLFARVYERPSHLIIVDSELNYFNHIHPAQNASEFNITTQFPKIGIYHLYKGFQPLGAIEQQFAFTLNVGNVVNTTVSNAQPDSALSKTFGNYEVTLNYPKPLKAQLLSVGQQELTFTIKDAFSKQPITTLKPYLASFGHLVMINQKTYDYLHVHPANLVAPKPSENGGPDVKFLPLGLYGPIKPGIYRVFAEFNPDNKLFTADFTISLE